MTDTMTLDLAIFNPEGDFEQCFVAGDVRTTVCIDRHVASTILNQLFGLVLGGGDESIRSAAGSVKAGEVWPHKEIEEATGIIMDSAMFDSTGARHTGDPKLVVTKTAFFWRISTQALGVLETERTDIMELKLIFGFPVPADVPSLQSKTEEWLMTLVNQGTPNIERELLALRFIARGMLSQMMPSQLEAIVKDAQSLARVDGEDAEFPMLHEVNPSDSTKKLGSSILSEGNRLLARLAR